MTDVGGRDRQVGASGSRRRALQLAVRARVVLAAALGLGMPSILPAQDSTSAPSTEAAPAPRRVRESPWLPRLTLDNDAYNFWIHPGHRTDREYTDGVNVSLETLRAPWWGGGLGGGRPGCAVAEASAPACLSTQISLVHDMYTPNLERPPLTYPQWRDDRPYAAVLYLGAEGRRVSRRALRTYTVNAGVMGPPALGKLSQGIAHTITRKYTTKAEGWETQVAAEPALLVGVRQSLLAARWAPGGRGVFDLAPSAALSAGNIRTAAEAGARARLGINMSHPWDPRMWRQRREWEFSVSAGARREYVMHDFSLDGTLLRAPNRSVVRVPSVGEYELGTAVRFHRLSLGYRVITRSREYTTGPSRHVFSEMTSAIEFYP